MRAARTLSLALLSTMFVCLAACDGSDGTSEYPSQEQDVSKPNPASGGSLGPGGAATPPGSDDLSACASSQATAEPKPVYLVFAYDKSGSMDDAGKWTACKAATKAFFESPSSAGVHASITFFPAAGSNFCSEANYETPAVAMTALPASTLSASLDARSPDGYTPTNAALSGAIAYGKSLQASSAKDGVVAIVMVTDGDPNGCDDSGNVGPAAAEAASVASVLPTYVVGVGSSLGNLDQIAAAGGTGHAFIVSVGNPVQTQADLSAAIDTIKKSALSCNYTIPAPPSGETLDRSKVNVVYTPSGGAASPLGYNPSCAGGTGWRYDDPAQPKEVVLCEAACNAAKAGAGKVDIVFGCATRGSSIK